MTKVRGSGLECQAATVQERPRGAALHPRSVAAGRRHPTSQVGAARRSHLAPKAGVVTLRSHPEPEARAGSQEEKPEEW